jgi:nicotinate phosphoribosyltransferase
MNTLARLYRDSLGLLNDLYQLTMAYGYWKAGRAEHEAVFHLFFREHPFNGQFAVACGLNAVVDLLAHVHYSADDVEYLASLAADNGQPLFEPAFLDYLRGLKFRWDVDAVPEGTAVFAHEPLVRVRGPLLQAQLLETPLLNLCNFPTLVATKAARIGLAAGGDPVLEFGLRRAQGTDGGVSASRAAYVGGCVATSNLLAGKLFDIPVRGTHAHSWVMAFGDERAAFESYADALPHNCVLLVDTYDTLAGVRHAVEIGRRLKSQGHRLAGIRLDSGDIVALSRQARQMLNDAGLHEPQIVASDELDEHAIARLKAAGAAVDVWAVGTRLATAYEQPALGGVYKLAAVRPPGEPWRYCVKLSEQPAKVSQPGVLQIRRFQQADRFVGDMIYDENNVPADTGQWINQAEHRREPVPPHTAWHDLLVAVYRNGQAVYQPPSASEARQRALTQVASLPPEITRLERPQHYPVGVEPALGALTDQLLAEARAGI